MDFLSGGILEQDALDVGDTHNLPDSFIFEGERCGICMDLVIDRGALDCCQHWFCFACIDNWATITNLCPLCQNEFQLITCVPVYDTIGSNRVDGDSLPRDDDWCIEEKNSTLSFPSYYIDENAVICLDGDGCKIRSGSANIEEGSSLDTSVACDSCDLWYHASCVGFNPDGTSGGTWLCPRCVVNEDKERTEMNPVQGINLPCRSEDDNSKPAEDSFSGKVSVSVADTGETAVVVSMVGGSQRTPTSSEHNLSPLEVNKSLSVADTGEMAIDVAMVGGSQRTLTSSEQSLLPLEDDKHPMGEPFISKSNADILKDESDKIMSPSMEEQALELSLSHNVSSTLPSDTLLHNELRTSAHEAMRECCSIHGIKDSSRELVNESDVRTNACGSESSIGVHLGLSVGSFLSVGNINIDETKDQVTDAPHCDCLEEYSMRGEEIEQATDLDSAKKTGQKRKHADYSDLVQMPLDDGDTLPEIAAEVSHKKCRAEGAKKTTKNLLDASPSVIGQRGSILADASMKEKSKDSVKEDVTSDIMSIVKGTNRKLKGLAGPNSRGKISKDQNHMAGLRVKKIMRRAGDEKDSYMVVQNLRKEIRDAVRNNSSKNLGENLFDPKLLAAFRAVVVGPKTEPLNEISPLAVKVKKSMLQKGKVRENLTKKIYGTSNGRRKRAWDRDCEVEFWKHRCLRTTKPEKIETLRSVLDLLRKSAEGRGSEESESPVENPILSRLYLADTSVFPRKKDIQPLSALSNAGNADQIKNHAPLNKSSNQLLGNVMPKPTETSRDLSKAGIHACESKGNQKNVPGANDGSASDKLHPSSHSERKSVSQSGVPVVDKKDVAAKSNDIKSDKRKWALQVLAKKTDVAGRIATNKNQEQNAAFKGNYPLLAQLPADMRPVLAPSCHNKIPISVRQTQLYRLTEHFLKKVKLPVIRRTADTELAVADAINIEKEVADRSNSKLVYLNLCSQELLHRSSNRKSNITADKNVVFSSGVQGDKSEQVEEISVDPPDESGPGELSTDAGVEEALRNAGLVSDSPSTSPCDKRELCNDDDHFGPDNVFEMDSHQELDIYGDFEYDLEDEDYIGTSTAKVSNQQTKENISKVKVVFSTVNFERSDSALDSVACERSEKNELPADASCSGTSDSETVNGNFAINCGSQSGIASESFFGDGGEEPSEAECEELYGPDKEPVIKKFPDVVLEMPDQAIKASKIGNEKVGENVLDTSIGHSSSGNGNLPSASQTCEPIQKEKPSTATKRSSCSDSVSKKVEAYIKEHIRPLCKSGVITAEQYRWAVAKTTDKVMKHHCKAKNANFLIKEGDKIKKLAEQYVEAAQHNKKSDPIS